MKCMICKQIINQMFNLKQIITWDIISPQIVCVECRKAFQPIIGTVCLGCGRSQDNDNPCSECERWKDKFGYLLHNQALFAYDLKMKEFMKQYKFNGDYQLRKVFKTEVQSSIKQMQVDLVIPIPVTPVTDKGRGFNQVIGMLEGSEYTQVLATADVDKIEPQSHKTRQERLKLSQPFYVCEETASLLTDKNVLIVDDVYTTGTTLYHAANIIRKFKPRKLTSLTLAR